MNINELVKRLLVAEKKSQKDMAQYINVPTSTLNNWLKRGRSIPAEYIIPICGFLGVSCEYLLTGVESTKATTIKLENQPLTEAENDMLDNFRQLTTHQQCKLIVRAEDMVEENQKGTQQENVG